MLLPFFVVEQKQKRGLGPSFLNNEFRYLVTSTQRVVVARSNSSIVNRTALL